MSAPQQREFDRKLAELQRANGEMLALAEELRRELLDCGAAERTRELVESFLNEARSAAKDGPLPAALGEGMIGLLESLQDQYFVRM